MHSKKFHKLAGMVLTIPMICWALTGIVFFVKPGYQQAYEQIFVKTYPITTKITITPEQNWQEIKIIQTILGQHLLVKENGVTKHLDPITHVIQTTPSAEDVKSY